MMDDLSYELVYVIVNFNEGSKILQKAKELGFSGGTIFLGRGTVNNSLLNFLSLYDESKEILLMASKSSVVEVGLNKLSEMFHFHKKNHGIAFSISLNNIYGSSSCKRNLIIKERKNVMYQLITTIVNRGKAEDVIDAAKAAGSKGGTIVNARGSGIHETGKLFNMDIEPEKEIVLIIAKFDSADKIVHSISEALEINKPGNGVIFVQDAVKTYGLYE